MSDLTLKDFEPQYGCKFGVHDVGCPDVEWSAEDLRHELNAAKQLAAYLSYRLGLTMNKNPVGTIIVREEDNHKLNKKVEQ